MQVTKHVHALKIPFEVPIAPGKKVERFVYVYLIYSDRIWLIDTGVRGAERTIFEYIRKTGRKPEYIAGIVLTHSHPDHIGSVKIVQEAVRCVIAAHAAERNWIEDVHLQAWARPVPGFHSLVSGPVKVDRILDEGDVLDLGNDIALEVLHTPGHSEGSISLLLRNDGVLFSGDAVPISGDMPIYEDAIASAESIKKLKGLEGIKFLLASWDDLREGSSACHVMDNGLRYLERIQEVVRKAAGSDKTGEQIELCKLVLADLGLPLAMANPLVARSFQANLHSLQADK